MATVTSLSPAFENEANLQERRHTITIHLKRIKMSDLTPFFVAAALLSDKVLLPDLMVENQALY
jgi:hypothetical protein